MDDLSPEDRNEAFQSGWHVSFDGWAIVDEDFLFRSVNPQWLELLEVSATEFFGQSFADITPPEVRKIDMEQAELVKEGKISSYMLHKEYEFSDGTVRRIVLLVVRVPFEGHKPFKFYLSRIMLDEEITQDSDLNNQESTIWLKWIDRKQLGWAILSAVGLGIAYVIKALIGKGL